MRIESIVSMALRLIVIGLTLARFSVTGLAQAPPENPPPAEGTPLEGNAPGANPPVSPATMTLMTANKALKEKRYADALPLYQQVESQLSPTQRVNAWHSMGICHRELGSKEEALRAFATAVALTEDERLKRRSEDQCVALLMAESKWETAFAALQAAVAKLEQPEPTAARIAVRLAYEGYHQAEKFDMEAGLCAKVLETYPNERESCAMATVGLGSALIRQKKFEEGYAALRKVTTDYAEFRRLGAAALQRIIFSKVKYERDYQAALTEAIALAKDFGDQRWAVRMGGSNAVEAARAMTDVKQALTGLDLLSRLVSDEQTLGEICATAGDLALKVNQKAKAAEWYARVLRLKCAPALKESTQERWANLAVAAVDPKKEGEAVALGRLLLSQGSHTAAAAVAREVLKANPLSASAALLSGDAELARGNLQAAEQSLQTAVKLAPSDTDARVALAKVCELRSGAWDSFPSWTILLKLDPNSRRAAAVKRGWIPLREPAPVWTGGGKYASPSYSPDGRLITAAKQRDDQWDIVIIDPQSKTERVIARSSEPLARGYHMPRWSPDGKSIFFDLDYGGEQKLAQVIDISVAPPVVRKAISDVDRSSNVRFQPAGTTCLFIGPNLGLWTANADGTSPKELISLLQWGDITSISCPQWSADGKWMFCSASKDRHETFDIYRFDPAKPDEVFQLIAPGRHQARYPQLSPDGTSVVFARGDGVRKKDGQKGLWVVDAAGALEPYPIVEGDFPGEAPCDWRPDGRGLIYADMDGRLWEIGLGGFNGAEILLAAEVKGGQVHVRLRNLRQTPNPVTVSVTTYEATSARTSPPSESVLVELGPGEVREVDAKPTAMPRGGTIRVTAFREDGMGAIALVRIPAA